jgi:hypothetical protein
LRRKWLGLTALVVTAARGTAIANNQGAWMDDVTSDELEGSVIVVDDDADLRTFGGTASVWGITEPPVNESLR